MQDLKILLQQNLLEPVGRQEDRMSQHEVVQQRFYSEKKKQTEINRNDLQIQKLFSKVAKLTLAEH